MSTAIHAAVAAVTGITMTTNMSITTTMSTTTTITSMNITTMSTVIHAAVAAVTGITTIMNMSITTTTGMSMCTATSRHALTRILLWSITTQTVIPTIVPATFAILMWNIATSAANRLQSVPA